MENGAYSSSVLAFLLAGIVSTGITAVLVRSRSLPLDNPNERSLHLVPLPRTGGIAIIIGSVVAGWWLHAGAALLVPISLLAISSYLDDRRALPAPIRLALHLLAAGAFLWLNGTFGSAAIFIRL